MNARNRELLGLIPASLLVTAGFAGVFIQRSNALSNVSLTYGAIFLGLCVAGHVFIRMTLPNADPYMFPLVALLASFGIVMIYRIDPTLARQQAQWFVLGLVLFAATVVAFRDYRKLERYRYIIVFCSLGLLLLPRLPGIGYQANGAYLGVHIPGLFVFQPAEFAKIGLVTFLASYLRDTRQVMVMGARRVLGVTIPPIKHFGPVLVIWGIAMLILLVLHDIGSSLMFYGGLLAVLYVATSRVSFVVVGVAAFAIGAWYLGTHIPHVHDRVQAWLHPFAPSLYNKVGGSYQVANSMFAQAAGGMFGQGFGQATLTIPGVRPTAYLLPAPQTDMIYAVITDELGLFARGFKTALLANDSFSKLLAVGLSAVFALQVFVIVGGVTRVIPLTGVTLPFISYGGSSIVANFVLLAILLLVSDRARSPAR
jgi:cell division protein FtsW (lipid II flippase)